MQNKPFTRTHTERQRYTIRLRRVIIDLLRQKAASLGRTIASQAEIIFEDALTPTVPPLPPFTPHVPLAKPAVVPPQPARARKSTHPRTPRKRSPN